MPVIQTALTIPANESQGILEMNIPDYGFIGLLPDYLHRVKVVCTPYFECRVGESVAGDDVVGITGKGVDLS